MSLGTPRHPGPPTTRPGSLAEPLSPRPAAGPTAKVIAWPGPTRPVRLAQSPVGLPAVADPVCIETAQVRDWMSILDIVVRHFPLADERELRYYLCNQASWFHVLRMGDVLCGFVHLQPRPAERTMWLNMIAVEAPFRHLGCARSLLAHTELLSRRMGLEAIGLRVLPSNARALQVYRGQGYVVVGETYDEGDACLYWVMRKALSSSGGALRQGDAPADVEPDTGWRRWRNRLNYLVRIGGRSPLRGR